MQNVHKPYGPYERFFKRPLDFILALGAIIILSPVLLILTIAGTIAMKGNPFFIQKRPGRISKKTGQEMIFNLIKFRTMSNAKDKEGNLLPDENRLNLYGRLLRSSSCDELPELINILKGEMSIVGPRPQLVRDMIFMTPEQRKRHVVRQGLTGLAQVNGRNNIDWEEKFEYDLQYIHSITFMNDARIIFQTVVKVFKRKDIVRDGYASDLDFGEWLLLNKKIDRFEYENGLQKTNDLMRL